jgi:hypothetical protein
MTLKVLRIVGYVQRSIWEDDQEVVRRSGRDEINLGCNTLVHGNNARNLSV